MAKYQHQGEPCSFQTDGSTGAMLLIDANYVQRPLGDHERLIIDEITIDTAGYGSALVYADLDKNLSPLLHSIIVQADDDYLTGANNPSRYSGGPSGLALPVGILPACTSVNAVVVGVGRIVTGGTTIGRQSWQSRLNS